MHGHPIPFLFPAAVLVAGLIVHAAPAQTTFTVTATTDANPFGLGIGSGAAGDLRYCIHQANALSLSGQTVTINFALANNSTITLGNNILPPLNPGRNGQLGANTNSLLIDGSTATNLAIDGGSFGFGIFMAYSGTITIQDLTLANGLARGGAGGAGGGGGGMGAGGGILVNNLANVTATSVVFNSTHAQGGAGGNAGSSGSGSVAFGGGGGTNGGNGGSGGPNPGGGAGGGGGLGGNGGNGNSSGGGGGGGVGAAGGNAGSATGGAGGIGQFTNGAAGATGGGTGGGAGGTNGGGGGGGHNADGAGGGVGGSGVNGGFGGGGQSDGTAGDFGGTTGGGTFGSGVGGYGGGGGGNSVSHGGFGGGGGAGPGTAGFGAGIGGSSAVNGSGGGGLGAGGAAFVRAGGTLTLIDPVFTGTITVTGGAAGGSDSAAGQGIGQGLFLGGNTTLSVSAGNTLNLGGGDFVGGRGTQPASADPTNGAAGALTKVGLGTLILGGPNSYFGGTTISGGTLRADNATGSATGQGAVLVGNGGTLAGGNGGGSANPFADSTQGFLAGAVTVQNGGTLSPGVNGTGLLTTSGTVTFQTGAFWAEGLGTHNSRPGASPADMNTNTRVRTSLDMLFGSNLTISIDGGGQTFAAGTYDYFIGRADGTMGILPGTITFAPTDFGSPVSPSNFQLSESADLHSLILTFTPVPEPGSLILVGTVAAVGGWRLRRRAMPRRPA